MMDLYTGLEDGGMLIFSKEYRERKPNYLFLKINTTFKYKPRNSEPGVVNLI